MDNCHSVRFPLVARFSQIVRILEQVILRYNRIAGFGLVEMTISTNPKPTIYWNLYKNTGLETHVDHYPLTAFVKLFISQYS